MSSMFRLMGLTNVVTGSQTEKPSTTMDIEQWECIAGKALILIIRNCEDESQALIAGCETASEAWKTLKDHEERCTRMHLSALLLAITSFQFDNGKGTIDEHIALFEHQWNQRRQNVASETAGTTRLAAGIKNFTYTDGWKATMLSETLPNIQVYQNINHCQHTFYKRIPAQVPSGPIPGQTGSPPPEATELEKQASVMRAKGVCTPWCAAVHRNQSRQYQGLSNRA